MVKPLNQRMKHESVHELILYTVSLGQYHEHPPSDEQRPDGDQLGNAGGNRTVPTSLKVEAAHRPHE